MNTALAILFVAGFGAAMFRLGCEASRIGRMRELRGKLDRLNSSMDEIFDEACKPRIFTNDDQTHGGGHAHDGQER